MQPSQKVIFYIKKNYFALNSSFKINSYISSANKHPSVNTSGFTSKKNSLKPCKGFICEMKLPKSFKGPA